MHRVFSWTEVERVNSKFLTGSQARPFQNIRSHVDKTNANAVFNAVIRPPMGAIFTSLVGFFHYSAPRQIISIFRKLHPKEKKSKKLYVWILTLAWFLGQQSARFFCYDFKWRLRSERFGRGRVSFWSHTRRCAQLPHLLFIGPVRLKGHRYIIKHFIHNQILRSISMSSDELLANQQTILSNQITILSNQETILVNQEKLDRIFSNQDRILANQETILANQELILAKLS